MKRCWWVLAMVSVLFASCIITQPAKTGETYFAEKQYTVAADLLQSEFSKEPDQSIKARKAFLIGECYRLSGQTIPAEQWYKTAVLLNSDERAKYLYALMLKSNEKYAEAATAFSDYVKENPFDEDAKEQVEDCNMAVQWKNDPTKYDVTDIESLNSPAYDYAPRMYGKNGIVFTSDRDNASGEKIYGWTGEHFSDLYVAYNDGKENFGTVTPFSDVFNTNYNEGVTAFNKDFSECYFTRCGSDETFNDYCKIMYTYRNGETWSEPEALPLFDDSTNVSQPFLTSDGRELYFSSDADGGFGGKDLYVITKTADGWSDPLNLGPAVNTNGDEEFPIIASDGKLYFSSNGQPGMGGLDIFSSSKIGKQWGNIQNLKSPINSGADDFGLIFQDVKPEDKNHIKQQGYFTSNRPGGKGQDDIYSFILPSIKVYLIKGDVMEKTFSKPNDPNSGISGYLPLAEAQINLSVTDENGILLKGGKKQLATDVAGKFLFAVDAESYFMLTASKDGYFSKSQNTNTNGFSSSLKDTVIAEVHFVLDKIYKNVQVNLSNIYYDYNKWDIRPDAAKVLDTLVTILKENSNVKVEIGSHTDSRGKDQYNLTLSQKRAQSVVDYLVAHGIETERLTAKGYGETQLVNGCDDGVPCSEEQHQQNRRTTFKVTSDNFNINSTAPEKIVQDPNKKE